MLETLKAMKDRLIVLNPEKDDLTDIFKQNVADEVADKIQAEVDEKYTFGKIPNEYWPLIEAIENRVTPEKFEEIAHIYECYGSIDEYVKGHYFKRPVDENGDPVEFGKMYMAFGEPRVLEAVSICGNGEFTAMFANGFSVLYEQGQCLKLPPEPDTQEKLNEDVCNETPASYCKKYDLNYFPGKCEDIPNTNMTAVVIARMHMLARQRKLDGVE